MPENAYRQGRVDGLALAALIISISAFIQLLGAEKAIVGIVLGSLALGGAHGVAPKGRKLAIFALVISITYILVLALTLVFAGDELMNILQALKQNN